VGFLTRIKVRGESEGGEFSGVRGKKSAVSGQRAEGSGQRAEGRGQRAEGRGQRAEGRGQRAEEALGLGSGGHEKEPPSFL
jgi:hypothetical protein